MTTAAQIKKLVRPLLDRHSDLVLMGNWIYLKPVHHFARAILVDRTSSADQFSPRWVAIHLFEWRKHLTLSWGSFLSNKRSPNRGVWQMSQPDIGEALIEAIEQQALPWLRAMATLDLYLDFVSQNLNRGHLYDRGPAQIIVHVAVGHIDAARALAERNAELWSVDKPEYDEDDKAMLRRLRQLCAFLKSDDRAGLARLLHTWEAETVKNFKIEHLWEPTPFPLELQSA